MTILKRTFSQVENVKPTTTTTNTNLFLTKFNQNKKKNKKNKHKQVLFSRYEVISILGQGVYGKVYKCLDTISGKLVAIKEFLSKDFDHSLLRELYVLKRLHRSENKHIVPLHAIISDPRTKNVAICMPAMSGSLVDLLPVLFSTSRQNKKPEESEFLQFLSIMRQVLEGVSHCHSNDVWHRDLKLANILFDSFSQQIYIADFGLAKVKPLCQEFVNSHDVCTLEYRAPELLLGFDCYNGASLDMWSVGVIMLALLSGKEEDLWCMTKHLIRFDDLDKELGIDSFNFLTQENSEQKQLTSIMNVLGAPEYESKELFGYNTGSDSVDMYLENCVMLPRVDKKNVMDNKAVYFQQICRDVVPQHYQAQLIDFLLSCFHYNWSLRLKSKKALSHPLFFISSPTANI